MKLISFLAVAGSIGLFFTLSELRAETGEGSERQTTYYPNGRLQTEVGCDATGARDGAFHRYLADGRLEAEGEYSGGRMEGEWRWFRPDGSVDAEKSGLYRGGRRVADLP